MAGWINRLLSLIALAALFPVMLIAASGILLSDFGPVFYKAKRAGIRNTSFEILKFRSMRKSKAHSSRITSKNDSRIFLWGLILRTLKIDELPQLINILQGDMAIIGPRPEDQSIVDEHYDNVMLKSLDVLPGMASPGSIYNYTHLEELIHESSAEDQYFKKILPIKVRLDVVYASNKSLSYDVELILRTLWVIIQKIMGRKKFPAPKELEAAKKLL